MDANKEASQALMRGVKYLVEQSSQDTTKIYNGVVVSITNGYTIRVNGNNYNMDMYGGGDVAINSVVKVFVPQGNMNLAFFMLRTSGGGEEMGLPILIKNDIDITPTGTYATDTSYNTTYGVKVGYLSNGTVMVTMVGGTSTGYENLLFTKASAPSGVTIANITTPSSSNQTGNLYGCIISGLNLGNKYNMTIAMNTRDASADTVTCAITLTQA